MSSVGQESEPGINAVPGSVLTEDGFCLDPVREPMPETKSENEEGDTEGAKDDEVEIASDAEQLLPRLHWDENDVYEFQALWLLLKRSFNEDMTSLGVDLLIWMLDTVTGAKKFFLKFNPGDKTKPMIGSEFMTHGYRIASAMDTVVNSLNQSARTLFLMRALARQHVHMKIDIKYFEDFRDKFHLFLFESAGFKKESRQAALWLQFLTGLTDVFREEQDAILGPPVEEKKGCCSVL